MIRVNREAFTIDIRYNGTVLSLLSTMAKNWDVDHKKPNNTL
jgi:hypothetical protein